FEQIVSNLLTHLRDAFSGELAADRRAEFEKAEDAPSKPADKLLAGQVFLARRLPDYWQRFEAHVAEYEHARLDAPGSGSGWLSNLVGRSPLPRPAGHSPLFLSTDRREPRGPHSPRARFAIPHIP